MKKIALIIILFVVGINALTAQNIDINIVKEINGNRTTFQDDAFKTITNSVTPVMMATPIVMAIVGKLSDDPNLAKNLTFYAGSMITMGGSTLILKRVFNRQRPFEAYPDDVTKLTDGGGGSFPSGHTSSAFATATSLSITYPKWYVIAPAYTWASLVGYSRIYLGVHYPSDVVAGALLGSGSAYLSHKINEKLWQKAKAKKSLAYYYDLGE
ncbi:MAG: phosphatase PAP2 family protein [Bacteroidales bacterium]